VNNLHGYRNAVSRFLLTSTRIYTAQHTNTPEQSVYTVREGHPYYTSDYPEILACNLMLLQLLATTDKYFNASYLSEPLKTGHITPESYILPVLALFLVPAVAGTRSSSRRSTYDTRTTHI